MPQLRVMAQHANDSGRLCSLGLCVALALSATACLAPTPSAKTQAEPAKAMNVPDATGATIEGFVTQIDEAYTRGDSGPYPLTAGCHIVSVSAEPPRQQGSRISATKPIEVVHFAIAAKPGHRYVVTRDSELLDGRYRRIVVSLESIAPDGSKVLRRGSPDNAGRPTNCAGDASDVVGK